MNLPFSLYHQDKTLTHFPHKIMRSIIENELAPRAEIDNFLHQWKRIIPHEVTVKAGSPKDHTIRLDIPHRWAPDMDIHFVINNRTKDRYQFAPIVKCTGVQDIFMSLHPQTNELEVSFDDGRTASYIYKNQLDVIAKRDGFKGYDQFADWFTTLLKKQPDQCTSARIIHWTKNLY